MRLNHDHGLGKVQKRILNRFKVTRKNQAAYNRKHPNELAAASTLLCADRLTRVAPERGNHLLANHPEHGVLMQDRALLTPKR